MDARSHIFYGKEQAKVYAALGIDGTTYKIGFDAVSRLVGDISGSTFLDFGAGSGRGSRFLVELGASHVYAVDHNEAMITEGRAACGPGIEYRLSHDDIPLDDKSVDGAISLSVFIELTDRSDLHRVCKEVHRVLKDDGVFIVMTTNPDAFGHEFLSFEYESPSVRRGGSRAICRVRTTLGNLELEDTYWDIIDYTSAFEAAGFTVAAIERPLGHSNDFPVTEESTVPPFLVVKAVKYSASKR